jgi:hypothetical protein
VGFFSSWFCIVDDLPSYQPRELGSAFEISLRSYPLHQHFQMMVAEGLISPIQGVYVSAFLLIIEKEVNSTRASVQTIELLFQGNTLTRQL